MSYNPVNPNGQASMANSSPVVIASDQTAVPVSVSGVSTAAHQTDGTQKSQVVDGSGNVITSTSNALDVNIKSGSTGSAATDEAAWTAGTSTFSPSGGVFNDSAAALTTGQQGTKRLTPNRAVHTNLRNNSGTEIATASAPIRIDPTGTTTQPVSGTITANAGTGNFGTNVAQVSGSAVATAASGIQKIGVSDGTGNAITSTSNALDVNIKSGGSSGLSVVDEAAWTAGTSSMVPAGATFNDSAAVLTSGQQGTLRATNNRGLHTNIRNAAGTELATNTNPLRTDPTGTTTQPVSGTVTANAGTNLNTSLLALETGGNLATTATNTSGLNNTVGTAGSAIPTKGIIVQGSDGTNARALKTDASGNVNVNVQGTPTVSGTVTANVGTTNGLALDASVTGLQVSQGSTTSGQKGDLVQGAVTTAAPSYTTAQTSPLSLDTSGNLRTSINSTVTVNGTVTANQGGAPWSDNVSQFGGSAVATGVGASGSGIPRVTVANDSNILSTQSGTWTVQPGNTPNTTPWLTSLQPATSGGWSVSSQTALTNSAVSVKSSAGQFGGYMFFNPNSSVAYIQVFNVASGGVTVGTTTPTYVIPIPAASAANIEFANGIAHSTAISVTATATATGNTAPTTALVGFVVYK